jgi:hypothetical protein
LKQYQCAVNKLFLRKKREIFSVIPAKAGIQSFQSIFAPAFAGVTGGISPVLPQ